MKKNILLFLFILFTVPVIAQTDTVAIPIYRQLAHDKIAAEQRLLDKADGKMDNLIRATDNPEINLTITDVMTRRIKLLTDFVELNKKIATDNEKKKYLKYIENLVAFFRIRWKTKEFNPLHAPQLVDNFETIMKAHIEGTNMTPYIETQPYGIAKINTDIFTENIGHTESKKITYLKFCTLNPDKIIQTITPFANEPFADSLIVISCRYNPTGIYSAAQATGLAVNKLIIHSKDPFVKAIVNLSKMPNGLLYFPFIDEIVKDNKTIDKIKKILGNESDRYDSVGYYKLLVQTAIDYHKRVILKDTPVAMYGINGLLFMLNTKALQHFITPINELHEKPESIRMRAVEPLSSIDLYYMIIMGENDIYTSSYKHSFNRLIQRLGKNARTDSLLISVGFDHFRKFIKMAANFNKLDMFLALMSPENSKKIMKDFVANLDKAGDLEDAVDVADAYSSINNKKLLQTILEYVNANEQNSINNGSERGKIIYNLLKKIFLSADNKIDLTKEIGIPSIYSIDNKYLADDNGVIIEQVFFYGDKDGKNVFNGFVNSFSVNDWKIINTNKEWVEIKSIKEPKVWIYANRPLDSDANLDDSAQTHLNKYLDQNNLHPAIVIHRGHSYWLPGTIARMPGDAKIVMLGSCGGYKNLSKIIANNPDAHIISTKEIGKGDINKPIINYLNQTILSGKTLIWKDMWATLTKAFSTADKSTRDSWEDYVPPYKNLGAIFIKAYNEKMNEE